MITHELQQGTDAWHQFRAQHFTASDAPAMMGVSPYKSRNQLLREKATGICAEVDSATQRRFDDGHRFEALARPLAKKIIGAELYPVVGSEGKYAASFDGITMLEDVIFEHKTANGDILSRESAASLPEMYRIQMEQQLLVSGAEKCLFMATRWDADGNLIGDPFHVWYELDLALRQRIVAGWEQFEKDLADYQHREIAEKPKPEAIMDLPALAVQAQGMVTYSNLPEFKAAAESYIANINTNLQTDSDFANAEATVKFCKSTEEKLDLTKKAILAQTATIDEVIRTVEHIQAQLRDKRLDLDKKVKTEKEKRKAEMVAAANTKYADHVSGLQAEIAGIRINLLLKTPDFGGAIKGLKSLASMHDALDTALANGKIEADAVVKDVRDKLAWYEKETGIDAGCYGFLFPNLQQLIGMDRQAFEAVIKNRITEHQKTEAAKLEAERARMESEAKAKAEREAAAKLAQEESRIRAEERAKAKAEANARAPAITLGDAMHDAAHAANHAAVAVDQLAKAVRPTRMQMIDVIAKHYGISVLTADEWLRAEFAEVAA